MSRMCQNNCTALLAMSRVCTLIVLLCVTQFSTQRSTPEDDHYVAAVVEYRVLNDVPTNLQNYVNLIKDASGQNADIIVFPELTLSRGRSVVIPILGILKDYPVPALRPDLYDEVLVTISSAARQNALYVVINIEELVDCTQGTSEYCPKQEVYLFNTNVVFDRTGAVIDRYRKINLFGEYTRTPALQPDLGIFTTDFGVTFGHFICFDLMFQVPAVQLVDKYNLTDIIFPTMWFSEMPYLTAVQIQEAYAYSMNVNFLGAGANNVNVGSAGSGIYSGKAGALVSIMPGVPTTRLLVATVPKIPGQISGTYPGPIYDDPNDHDNLTLIADPSLPSHTSKLLTPGFQEITLTDKDVTCHFRVRLNQRNSETSYHYRAFIQDGTTTYSRRPLGVAACSLVACKTDDVKSCPHRYRNNEENYEFNELEITMTTYRDHYNETLECSDIEYYGVSLTNDKYPLSPSNFTYVQTHKNTNGMEINNENKVKRDDFESLTFKITKPQTDLVSFGIWGRLYTRDGGPGEKKHDDAANYIKLEEIIYGDRKVNEYRVAAFSGVRSFSGVATGGTRVCSVIACNDDSIDSCGRRFPNFTHNTTAIFGELEIVAEVPAPLIEVDLGSSDSAYFPVSLDTSIMPLEADEYTFEEVNINSRKIYKLILNNLHSELYAFSIWGREYGTDGQEASPPVEATDAAVVHNIKSILLLISLYVILNL